VEEGGHSRSLLDDTARDNGARPEEADGGHRNSHHAVLGAGSRVIEGPTGVEEAANR
jgi:hypothetical protein